MKKFSFNQDKFFGKVVLVVVWFLSATSVNAQDWLLSYGPGSPAWCWQQQQEINAMRMQNMIMQQQLVQFYRNQAAAVQQQIMSNPFQPVQGIVTRDGNYITPQTVNQYTTTKVDCEHCDGGFNYKTIYVGSGNTRTVKERCSWCHGNGTVTKRVSQYE